MIQHTTSRREREDQQRRQDILSVAEDLFSRQGYHETSVSDIAKNVEMGIGTVYKYFKDKQTLFHELMVARLEETMKHLLGVVDVDGDPYEIINAFIDGYVDHVSKNPNFLPIYMSQIHYQKAAPERFRNDMARIHECKTTLLTKLVDAFDRGVEQGRFVKVNSVSLMVALFGMVMSHFLLATSEMISDEELDADEIKQTIKTIFFQKVLVDETK